MDILTVAIVSERWRWFDSETEYGKGDGNPDQDALERFAVSDLFHLAPCQVFVARDIATEQQQRIDDKAHQRIPRTAM